MRGKPLVGVWVDHRCAMLFWSDRDGEMEKMVMESEYQEEGEPIDVIGRSDHGGAVPHADLQARRHEQLKHYYKKLGEVLRSAEEIFLFGPGQAKKELAALIRKDKGFRGQVKGVENADKKMTEGQMAAKTKDFFGLPH